MTHFPQSFTTGILRWQIATNRPDRFRAAARLAWRQADTDAKALSGCGLLFILGGTLVAGGIGWTGLEAAARLLRFGPQPAALREALLFFAIALGWFALLYALFPKVWTLEARPGRLRFGWRTWEAGQVRALEVEARRGETDVTWDPASPVWPVQRNAFAVTVFWLRLADGRRLRVWQVSGRARKAAEAWVRRMAEVAGVPLRQAFAPRC